MTIYRTHGDKINTPDISVQDCSLFWLGTGTRVKVAGLN